MKTHIYREYRAIRTIDLTDGTGYVESSMSMRIEDGSLTMKVEHYKPEFKRSDKAIITLSKKDTEKLRQFLNIELKGV